MAHIVTLPQLGVSDESAVVSSFYVKEGDGVSAGQNIFALETGKSVFDVASEHDGVVLKFLCKIGDELKIQEPVMVIGAAGEGYADAPAGAIPDRPLDTHTIVTPQSDVRDTGGRSEIAPKGDRDSRVFASPRAKALAEKSGADISQAAPTGAEGFIIERDVAELLNRGTNPVGATASVARDLQQSSVIGEPRAARGIATATETVVSRPSEETSEYEAIPLSVIRRTIAKNMSLSLSTAAQLTHSSSFDATEILEYRKKCKASDTMKGVTIGDMVLFAVTRTLPQFPEMNSLYMDDGIHRYKNVHLAVAVDIPNGLVVPVIRDANRKSLLEISGECKALAKQAREGTIAPDRLTGGTFTVSNLGSLCIEHFTPIINPPQVGILGVNCSTLRPRKKDDGGVEFYEAIGLSLTYDHRAVDGAPASRFLKCLCENLSSFTLLLGK
ncbi:MAG: 2-oxo acid dehydrogenase subunit E2 [Oscillospiraceae bacterium]|jgi:pyruvate dehydrogenase E2 component (dihydrolipoamide acetyltransferase)|nr:2-oxo acid dehydrogenase subunit E2 [Oscillospiraceae bacterium]